MRATGARTDVQTFEVNGRIPQSHRTLRSGGGALLVIGAHYDSCGDTPGADDNASGVAGLLELAACSRRSRRRTVELVAYTLEEPPFFRTDAMGSFGHARELRANRKCGS